jgi:hypothetical protein
LGQSINVVAGSSAPYAYRGHDNNNAVRVDPVNYSVALHDGSTAKIPSQHPAKRAALLVWFIR